MDSTVELGVAPADAAEVGAFALELEGIVKRWPGVAAPVLDGVSLRVRRGETVAITGRNGAGKTTLLRIAAGLIVADEGRVAICGLDPERSRTECQRRLGFLAAGNSGLFARLKVEQHLDYWARLALLPRERRRQAIAATLVRFSLAELCGRRVDRLSMGQRQRLRIALAFLHEPDVVMLDEPLTSLDEEGAELVGHAIADLAAAGGAAVICAPTGEDAGADVDRVLVVADGGIEEA
jgi:ABC-2 type transport system ATP-binding protein